MSNRNVVLIASLIFLIIGSLAGYQIAQVSVVKNLQDQIKDRDTQITTLSDELRREDPLLRLSNDTWCKQRILAAFNGFTNITYLGNMTDTAEKLREPGTPNMAKIVVLASGRVPGYFRWFTVQQSTGDHWHVGFITSDLEVYDLGLDVGFQ